MVKILSLLVETLGHNGPTMITLDTVTVSEFEARLHEIFSLVVSDGKFPLELARVTPLGGSHGEAKRKPFSILFKAPHPIRLPQGIYPLENDVMGIIEIFIVQTSHTELEAIFT